MRRRLSVVFTLAAVVGAWAFLSPGLAAQQAAPAGEVPPVLQVGIEVVRAGRGAPHTAHEQNWAHTFRQSGVPAYWLGATTVTGPSEYWWFTALSAVGQLEAQDKAVADAPGLSTASDLLSRADAENVSETRSFLARHRADLSRPGGTPVALARYFQVIVWRVRPGHASAFEDAAKLYAQIVTEAKIAANWVTYQVASGMPENTFLVFVPMKSLGEMDPGPDMAALQKAMTPARQKQFNDMAAAGYLSVTNMVFRLQPRMSYLPAEFTDQDPAFWNARP